MLFFNLILKENLSPNQFYVLNCIKQKTQPVNVNLHQELRGLITEGWLRLSIKDLTVYLLEPKAEVLISKFSGNPIVDDLTSSIIKYNGLFPKGKLPSGKLARVNPKNLETALKWFFENFDYDWNTILRATACYVDDYEKRGYLYMQTSQYFIRKQQVDRTWQSDLANWCELIISGEDTSDNHFKENVV